MKNPLRSSFSTEGRRMAGARALWRANGMKEEQFGKPVIAIVNSFTQFVPGHTHLHEIGQYDRYRRRYRYGARRDALLASFTRHYRGQRGIYGKCP